MFIDVRYTDLVIDRHSAYTVACHTALPHQAIYISNLSRDSRACPGTSRHFNVDRTTPLGNPWHIGPDYDRDAACRAYWHLLASGRHLGHEVYDAMLHQLHLIREALALHGTVTLSCHCAPARCHAETIAAAVLNRQADAPLFAR